MGQKAATQFTGTRGTLVLAVVVDPKLIGKRIADARTAKGWTQVEFAIDHAHVSPSSVARWEAGGLPPVRELMRIAEILNVSPDWLLESPPDEALTVSQRLARLEAGDVETREMLRRISVKLGVPVAGEPPRDEEPAI